LFREFRELAVDPRINLTRNFGFDFIKRDSLILRNAKLK